MAPQGLRFSLYSSLSVFTAAENIQFIWKHTDASTKWLVSLTKCTHGMSLSVLHSSAKCTFSNCVWATNALIRKRKEKKKKTPRILQFCCLKKKITFRNTEAKLRPVRLIHAQAFNLTSQVPNWTDWLRIVELTNCVVQKHCRKYDTTGVSFTFGQKCV